MNAHSDSTGNAVTTTSAPQIDGETQVYLPTIAPANETVPPKTRLDFSGLLSTNETKFKTNFVGLISDISRIQMKQSCGCETYLRNLGEIRRRAISVITQKSLCVFKSIFYMRDDPIKKRELFEGVVNELHSAKNAITEYIKEQERISYGLILLLNNAPWVAEMTRIVQNAMRRQTIAAKYLVHISLKVPEDVNLRYGHFESVMKRTEEIIKASQKGKN